jgi:hypothetical protein
MNQPKRKQLTYSDIEKYGSCATYIITSLHVLMAAGIATLHESVALLN